MMALAYINLISFTLIPYMHLNRIYQQERLLDLGLGMEDWALLFLEAHDQPTKGVALKNP